VGVFLLGFAVGMGFLISWASRSPIAPWLASYFMAQITAVAALGLAIWLLLGKTKP
jgi:hypothetical protein